MTTCSGIFMEHINKYSDCHYWALLFKILIACLFLSLQTLHRYKSSEVIQFPDKCACFRSVSQSTDVRHQATSISKLAMTTLVFPTTDLLYTLQGLSNHTWSTLYNSYILPDIPIAHLSLYEDSSYWWQHTLYPHLSITSRICGGREESIQERIGLGILPPLVVML